MAADETREPVDVLRIVGTREAIKRVFPWYPLRIREDNTTEPEREPLQGDTPARGADQGGGQ